MKSLRKSLAALFLITLLSSCGGKDDGFDALLAEYSGNWDARYNLSLDDCGLVEAGVVGFVDRHSIQQDGSFISLEPDAGFGGPLEGETREDNSFTVEQVVSGDIFGDGIPCDAYQAISYRPTDTDTASTLFIRQIVCADGYSCESRALGESVRR